MLFASAVVDYDYIMGLIARYSQAKPGKQKMTREQLISLLASSANLMDERADVSEYITTLEEGGGLTEKQIREGYETFKAERSTQQLAWIADRYALEPAAPQAFVTCMLDRMIFDGEQLSDLLDPLQLGWKAKTEKELALMEALMPLLHKQAQGREISGLQAYE